MCKAAKFTHPVVWEKRVCDPNKTHPDYQFALFSFLSTGATNILTVNSVLDGKFYVRQKKEDVTGTFIKGC